MGIFFIIIDEGNFLPLNRLDPFIILTRSSYWLNCLQLLNFQFFNTNNDFIITLFLIAYYLLYFDLFSIFQYSFTIRFLFKCFVMFVNLWRVLICGLKRWTWGYRSRGWRLDLGCSAYSSRELGRVNRYLL